MPDKAVKEIQTIKSILELDPFDLADYLVETYYIEFPHEINNSDDLKAAGNALNKFGVTLQFFHELSAYAKRYVRIAKRELPKTAYEDMIDRREIISEITDALEEVKNGLSRNITAYINGLNEEKYL